MRGAYCTGQDQAAAMNRMLGLGKAAGVARVQAGVKLGGLPDWSGKLVRRGVAVHVPQHPYRRGSGNSVRALVVLHRTWLDGACRYSVQP